MAIETSMSVSLVRASEGHQPKAQMNAASDEQPSTIYLYIYL